MAPFCRVKRSVGFPLDAGLHFRTQTKVKTSCAYTVCICVAETVWKKRVCRDAGQSQAGGGAHRCAGAARQDLGVLEGLWQKSAALEFHQRAPHST